MAIPNASEQTLESYIERCMSSEEDPALLFSWEPALDAFVKNANALSEVQPSWISSAAGQMSADSFKQDVINYLALVGGGSFGNVLIAPNTLPQFSNVCSRLTCLELEPFVQNAKAGLPTGSVLAYTGVIEDKKNVRGALKRELVSPLVRGAPTAPSRQVFFRFVKRTTLSGTSSTVSTSNSLTSHDNSYKA